MYLALKSTILASVPLPDLPLLMVFFAASRRPSVEGVAFAFVLGYVEDVLEGGIIGSSSFALIAVFLVVHLLSMRVHFSTAATRAGGAAMAVLIKGLLIYIVISTVGLKVHIFVDVILQAVVTGVFAHAIITVMARLAGRIAPGAFKGDLS